MPDTFMPLSEWQGDGVPDVRNRAFDPTADLKNVQDQITSNAESAASIADRKVDILDRSVALDEMKLATGIDELTKFDAQLRVIALQEAVKLDPTIVTQSIVDNAKDFLSFLKGEI